MTFNGVSGMVSCCSGASPNGPDGNGGSTSLNSYNSISGLSAPSTMPLVAVFTSGTPSGPAPATLNFNVIGQSFTSLSPGMNQVFFVGDGLTGTGSGSTQTFIIPAGATDLWLGIADGSGFSGTPSFYGDNTGSFTGNYAITTPGTTVPESSSLLLLGTGLMGVVAAVRRRLSR